jgi:hypothetical protein
MDQSPFPLSAFNFTGDTEQAVTVLERAVIGLIIFDVFLGILLCVSTYYALRNCWARRRRRLEIPIADLQAINGQGPMGVGKQQPPLTIACPI